MNIYPIFARELRSEWHRRRLRKERFKVALFTGLGFAVLMVLDRLLGGGSVARWVSAVPFVAIAPFFLLTLGLTLGVGLLSVERREGLLPLLLLAHVTGRDIVLGKLFQAILLQGCLYLAAVPAFILPLIAGGFAPGTLALMGLACVNVLFFAVTLGLLVSVASNGRASSGYWFFLLAPLFLFSTPAGALIPAGTVRDVLAALQFLNPGEAMNRAQMAASGYRPETYWWPLLASHALGWGWVLLAGFVLPFACRRQAGANMGARERRRWWMAGERSPAWRARLLDRNAWHWRTSRDRGPTVGVWSWLVLSTCGMGWLFWLARGVGMPIYLVLTIGTAAFWHVILCIVIATEASRQLTEDRLNGAMEMVLCTPLGVEEIVRGQWSSLRRRYLAPLLTVLCVDAILMTLGYVTSGFGGMLQPGERGQWLFWWLAQIGLLPLWLTALAWVAMRLSLTVKKPGDAAAISIIMVMAAPIFALALLNGMGLFGNWRTQWWVSATVVIAADVAAVAVLGWRARRIFRSDLRQAAAGQPFTHPTSNARGMATTAWQWMQRMLNFRRLLRRLS